MRTALTKLALIFALSATAVAQSQFLTVNVDGAQRQISLSTSTAWLEAWSPGPLDVWVASRVQGTGWTVEYEVSARAAIASVGSVTIAVPGYPNKVISVGRDWPAGRSLSGRIGEEIPRLANWSTLKQTFGPLNIKLPTMTPQEVSTLTAWAGTKLSGLRTAIRTHTGFTIEDTYDGISSVAWKGPWGCWVAPDPGPGVPGGSGIYHTTGWQDVEAYAQLACEAEAFAMGRMWCLHNPNGTFFSVDDFYGAGQLSPNCNSEAGNKPAPFSGAPDDLWLPISPSHYPRVLRYCTAAYEMTGSRLARHHLIHLAESARLQFTERGEDHHDPGYIAWNLTSWNYLATHNTAHSGLIAPDSGQAWDRNHGWMLWAAAEAKKAGMPWTGTHWPDWAQEMVDSMALSQMPNGLIGRAYKNDVSTTRDVAAAMHEAILGMGLLAIHVQANIPIPTFLTNHAHTLYQVAPGGPYTGMYGPKHYLVVGLRNGATVPTITAGYGEPTSGTDTGDPIIVESYLAAVYALTGDTTFRSSFLQFGFQAVDENAKKAQMTSVGFVTPEDWMYRGWEAYLLAQLQ